MPTAPYRALRVVLGLLSLFAAVGSVLMILSSKPFLMRLFLRPPESEFSTLLLFIMKEVGGFALMFSFMLFFACRDPARNVAVIDAIILRLCILAITPLLSLNASFGGRFHGPSLPGPAADECLPLFQLSESATYALGLDKPFLGGFFRHLCPAMLSGCLVGLENSLAVPHQTYDYDVLVIGAGGAGLRGAIEAAAAGVYVGMVCKSLLGKAHTVMAEGGIAAALANVDERDNWKVLFADTMHGGQ
jgi:FAD binding domain